MYIYVLLFMSSFHIVDIVLRICFFLLIKFKIHVNKNECFNALLAYIMFLLSTENRRSNNVR